MAKRKNSAHRASVFIPPINPAINFLLFLALALILVVIVAGIMQKTTTNTKALLFCPQETANQVDLVENMSKRCPYGIQMVRDENGCNTWVCRQPPTSKTGGNFSAEPNPIKLKK